MCGLTGIYGEITKKEAMLFKWLLKFDELRGPHSTGVCRVKKDGDRYIYKNVGGTDDFFYTHQPLVKELSEATDLKLLLGHNRWATQGEINNDNAHPFEFDKVIGAHNGTIAPYMLRRLPEADKFKVDSQAIFNHIDKNSVEDLWKTTEGPMALSWWNKGDNSLNFVRNKDRPLHYLKSLDGKTLFWASEGWMLEVLLNRFGIKYQGKDAVSVPINTHIKVTTTDAGFLVLEEAKLAPFVWVAPIVQQGNWLNNKNDDTKKSSDSVYDYETVEIMEYHKQGPSEYDGWFFGKTAAGVEVKVLIESTFVDRKKESWKMIMDNFAVGKKKYMAKRGCFYSMKNIKTVHVVNMQVVDKPVTSLFSPKKDSRGYEVSPNEFYFLSVDGCSCCTARLSFADIPKYIAYPELDSILCDQCAKVPNNIEELDELTYLGAGKTYYAN